MPLTSFSLWFLYFTIFLWIFPKITLWLSLLNWINWSLLHLSLSWTSLCGLRNLLQKQNTRLETSLCISHHLWGKEADRVCLLLILLIPASSCLTYLSAFLCHHNFLLLLLLLSSPSSLLSLFSYDKKKLSQVIVFLLVSPSQSVSLLASNEWTCFSRQINSHTLRKEQREDGSRGWIVKRRGLSLLYFSFFLKSGVTTESQGNRKEQSLSSSPYNFLSFIAQFPEERESSLFLSINREIDTCFSSLLLWPQVKTNGSTVWTSPSSSSSSPTTDGSSKRTRWVRTSRDGSFESFFIRNGSFFFNLSLFFSVSRIFKQRKWTDSSAPKVCQMQKSWNHFVVEGTQTSLPIQGLFLSKV